MKRATEAVNKKQNYYRATSKLLNIPKTTLRRRCANKNKSNGGSSKGLGRGSAMFYLYGTRVGGLYTRPGRKVLRYNDYRASDYQFAEIIKLPDRFNHTEQMTGWD